MTYTMGLYIDGEYFDIPFISIKRKADFLDKYAERLMTGVLARELIGVYFNYTLSIGTLDDMRMYDRLWDKLTEAVEFHNIRLPWHDGSYYSYTAYATSVSDEFEKILDNEVTMKGLTFEFIAQKPARS